mgnify:CR=1 FL=1|jgi:TIGR02687 family protein
MLIDKIIEKFKEAKNGILLFFDGEKEYEEELLSYQGEEFRVLLVENNYFRIKYEVEYKKAEEKILLYHRFSQPKIYAEYPLVNLLFGATILAVDEVSQLMESYAIPMQHRGFIQSLQRWIKPKKNQTQLSPLLSQKPFNEEALAKGVVSVILEEKKIGKNTYNAIRVFELMNEGEEKWSTKEELLRKFDLEQVLIKQFQQLFGINVEDISYQSLRRLFLQVKYNAITVFIEKTKSADSYAKLKLEEEIIKTKISNFFQDWQNDKSKSKFMESVLEGLGMEVQLDKIIDVYGVEENYGIMTEQILGRRLDAVQKGIQMNPKEVVEKYGSWQNNPDEYSGYEKQVEFILNAARFYELKKCYSDFIFNTADEYLSLYTKELYLLDYYYRKAFIAYKEMSEDIQERYSETFAALNKIYDMYLMELNSPWIKELNRHEFQVKNLHIAKQYDFYKDFIKPSQSKKVVIISDAFRYELAKDLADRVSSDNHNHITCTAMLSAIPSYTNLGMSNLLPNNGVKTEISEGKIDYSINGVKTISTNRGKILQEEEPSSAVIDYATLSKFNREEGREFFRDKQVVYVYHNWMDTIGDKKASEYYTFESSQQCIDQLHQVVKMLYNNFNVGQIFITADHGFLFNYEKISEATSQSFPAIERVLKESARFAIIDQDFTSNDTYSFSLANTTNIDTDVQVVMPKTINRFKKKGNVGVQFVHGGASLQEVIVPVLEIKRRKSTNAEEVSFSLMSKPDTISLSIVKLKFLQNDRVGADYKSHQIILGIYDTDGNLISKETNIEFNKTAENAKERVYEIKMEMLSQASKHKVGYLKAYKAKDKEKLNAILDEMIKINILELDEF